MPCRFIFFWDSIKESWNREKIEKISLKRCLKRMINTLAFEVINDGNLGFKTANFHFALAWIFVGPCDPGVAQLPGDAVTLALKRGYFTPPIKYSVIQQMFTGSSFFSQQTRLSGQGTPLSDPLDFLQSSGVTQVPPLSLQSSVPIWSSPLHSQQTRSPGHGTPDGLPPLSLHVSSWTHWPPDAKHSLVLSFPSPQQTSSPGQGIRLSNPPFSLQTSGGRHSPFPCRQSSGLISCLQHTSLSGQMAPGNREILHWELGTHCPPRALQQRSSSAKKLVG